MNIFFLLGSTLAVPVIRKHCGPKDIPSRLSEDIASTIAKDEALVADALYTISKKEAATKRGILESVDIVANMSLPSDVKASKIAVIFARMRNSKVNKMHLFSAKYEVYRTERWSKNLKLMGLNASAVLSDTMKLPWNKEKEWTEADEKTKEKMIYDIIERQLCK